MAKQQLPHKEGRNHGDGQGRQNQAGGQQEQSGKQGEQMGSRRGQSTAGDQGGQGKQNTGRPGKGGS